MCCRRFIEIIYGKIEIIYGNIKSKHNQEYIADTGASSAMILVSRINRIILYPIDVSLFIANG